MLSETDPIKSHHTRKLTTSVKVIPFRKTQHTTTPINKHHKKSLKEVFNGFLPLHDASAWWLWSPRVPTRQSQYLRFVPICSSLRIQLVLMYESYFFPSCPAPVNIGPPFRVIRAETPLRTNFTVTGVWISWDRACFIDFPCQSGKRSFLRPRCWEANVRSFPMRLWGVAITTVWYFRTRLSGFETPGLSNVKTKFGHFL